MTTPAERLLATTPVWRRLSPADRALLGGIARVVEYPKGARVFEEGEPSDRFVTIASGRVKIVKSTPAGKDVIIEIFATGDPLGAVATYDGRPFPATAVALEPTTCLLVPRREFFGLLEQHPSLVLGLLSGLTLRLIELTNRVVEMNGVRVEPRFARLFLKMADESGRPETDGTAIPVALSRQELADLTGTTIETAIRIMSRWGKEGLVRTDRDGFTLLNRPALETIAED